MTKWSLFNFLGSKPPGRQSSKLRRRSNSEDWSSSQQSHQVAGTSTTNNHVSDPPHVPSSPISPRTIPNPRKRTIRAPFIPNGSRAGTHRTPAQFSPETNTHSSGHFTKRNPNSSALGIVVDSDTCELTASPGGLSDAGPNESSRSDSRYQPRRGSRDRKPIRFFDGSKPSPVRQDSLSPDVPKKRKMSDADADFEPHAAKSLKRKKCIPVASNTNIAANTIMTTKSEEEPKKRGKPRKVVSNDTPSRGFSGNTIRRQDIPQDDIRKDDTQIEEASNKPAKDIPSTSASEVSKTSKQNTTNKTKTKAQKAPKPKPISTSNAKQPVQTTQVKDTAPEPGEHMRSSPVKSKDQKQVSRNSAQSLVQEQAPAETPHAPEVATPQLQELSTIHHGPTLESTEIGDAPVPYNFEYAPSSADELDGDLDFGGDWFDMPKYKRDLIVEAMQEDGMDAEALADYWKPIFDKGQATKIARLLNDNAARDQNASSKDNALGIRVNRAAIYGDIDRDEQEELEFDRLWGGLDWMSGEIQRQSAEAARLTEEEELLKPEDAELARDRIETLEWDLAWLRDRSRRLVEGLTQLQDRREARQENLREQEERDRLRELFVRKDGEFDERHAPPPPSCSPPPFSPPSPPSALFSATSRRQAGRKRKAGDPPNQVALTSPTDADDELSPPVRKRRATTVTTFLKLPRTRNFSRAAGKITRARSESPESNLGGQNRLASNAYAQKVDMHTLGPALRNDSPRWTQTRESSGDCHSLSDSQSGSD